MANVWDDLLLDPIYDSDLAMDADLDLGTAGLFEGLRVQNRSQGELADIGQLQAAMMLAREKPAAVIRVSELTANGLTRRSIKGGVLTFNDVSWRIANTQPKPAAAGAGELILILQDP